MRHPKAVERMDLDFDGVFAAVEQESNCRLRGRPVGVVPFEGLGDRDSRLAGRLRGMAIYSAEDFYNLQPKQMRMIWHNVPGERL